MYVLIVSVIAGFIGLGLAVGGLYWTEQGSWFTGTENLTVWDLHVYAGGWTAWGNLGWGILTNYAVHYNEPLARALRLGMIP